MAQCQSPPRISFLWALGASIVLHGLGLLALDSAIRNFSRAPVGWASVIDARLELLPPKPPEISPPPRVLKNTLEPARPPGQTAAAPREGRKEGLRRPERLSQDELDEILVRMSGKLFYPPEAVRLGLEGETVLMLELGEGGKIVQASVVSGSGHPILDEAAVQAVGRLGALGPSLAGRAILLPVRFWLH